MLLQQFNHHHINRTTSDAGHKPCLEIATITSPALLASSFLARREDGRWCRKAFKRRPRTGNQSNFYFNETLAMAINCVYAIEGGGRQKHWTRAKRKRICKASGITDVYKCGPLTCLKSNDIKKQKIISLYTSFKLCQRQYSESLPCPWNRVYLDFISFFVIHGKQNLWEVPNLLSTSFYHKLSEGGDGDTGSKHTINKSYIY